jgi:transposase-like protein
LANVYPPHLRRQARRLWLSGKFTDEQIAAKLGLPRADTIRNWRNEEDWRPLADDIATVVNEEVAAGLRAKVKASRGIYEQLAQVLEGASVRHLKNPSLSPRDLKAISGALLNAQRIREKAHPPGRDDGQSDVATNLADLIKRARARRDRLSLGRCGVESADEKRQVDIAPDADGQAGNTATRGPGGVSAAPG